jgi:hypothetical protein
MAEVTIEGGNLIVRVRGVDKVWALKSELEIPLAHVAGAERDQEEASRWYHGIRLPGTNVPGVITAGSFYRHGERAFWDVHHPENAVAIRLRDESYGRLVVEVEDPDATIAMILNAVGGHGSSAPAPGGPGA